MDTSASTTYSTSIHDLPMNPTGGSDVKQNVSFSATENASSSPNITLDQTTINQIINGLQQAGNSTQLQSRDIPTTTTHLAQDPHVQANFIPQIPSSSMDYIKEEEDNDDIIINYNKNVINSNNLDQMYNELQTPILISVLFFLFQLPIFKKIMFTHLPILFFKDGNINLYGYTFTSIMFGLLYYILFKVMMFFNTF